MDLKGSGLILYYISHILAMCNFVFYISIAQVSALQRAILVQVFSVRVEFSVNSFKSSLWVKISL